MKLKNINFNFIKYVVSLVLFGTNGVMSRGLSIKGDDIALYRSLIGFIVLFIILVLKRHKFLISKFKSDWLGLVISGASFGLGSIFLFEAYNLIGVSFAELLYYVGPAIMMIISPFLYKEQMTKIKIIGFSIVLFGIYLIYGTNMDATMNLVGLLFGFLACISYVTLLIGSKMVHNVVGLESTFFRLLFGFIAVFIYKLFARRLSFYVPISDLPQVLYIGVISTALACYFYYTTVGVLPITTVCICGYIDPVSTLVFARIFLDERFTFLQNVGALCVMIGVLWSQIYEYKHRIRLMSKNR